MPLPDVVSGLLQREHHDVAQEDQPAVLHAGKVDDGVCDQDPDQQHQAEVKQETLGYGLVHRGVLSFSSVLTSVSFQLFGYFGKQHLH